VFVHISATEIDKYLAEFTRVLRKGGRAIIHHADKPAAEDHWRSRVTGKIFTQLLQKHGFKLARQFNTWGAAGEFNVGGDMITVFEN
jgi:ubiquinone/menaquinone biosynthesis C-methylase UbiE